MLLEEYVAARGQSLLRFAYLLTGDRYLAEDLVQNALVKAHRRWRWVVRADNPDAYVRKIIVNANLDRRRRRSSSEVPTDLTFERRTSPLMPDPAEAQASHDEMWRALATLPPRQRAVLVLRFYEDCDDATIAELIGCREGTVRSIASRALASVRAALTGASNATTPTRSG